jgi:hypothetical protein
MSIVKKISDFFFATKTAPFVPRSNDNESYDVTRSVFRTYNRDFLTSYNIKALIDLSFNVPAIYTALNYIAQKFSLVDFQITNKKTGDVYLNHELKNLFQNPYPTLTFGELLYRHYYMTKAAGDAYLNVVVPEGFNKPLFIVPLNSDITKPIGVDSFGNKSNLQSSFDYRFIDKIYYEYQLSGRLQNIDKDLVIHTQNSVIDFENRNFLRGLSSIFPILSVSNSLNSVFLAKSDQYKNGPSFIITAAKADMSIIPLPNTTTEIEKIEQKFSKYGAASAKGKIKVLQYPVDVTKLSEDLSGVNESQTADSRIIYAALNFPSVLANDDANSKYENIKQAKKSIIENEIIPFATSFADQLTNFFAKFYGNDFVIVPSFENFDELNEGEADYYDAKNTKYLGISKILNDIAAGLLNQKSAIEILKTDYSFTEAQAIELTKVKPVQNANSGQKN